MRVLFLSGIDGPCHRYQVLHRAAQLRRLGIHTRVCSFRDPRIHREAASHDLLFLYRVPVTAGVLQAIDRARSRGARVIGAIDDLIFSPDEGALPALEHLEPAEQALWRRGVERYRATLALCDAFVAPTEPLVAEATALGWDARLHRNAISPAEWALGAAALATAHPREEGVVLGYFSGTPTHDQDFAVIAPVLAEMLAAHPALRLRIVGPLRLDDALRPFAARIEQRGLVEWSALPALIAGVDVALAPVDTRRRFALAKGEVKYLEAAAVAVPLVASATPAFRHAIGDGRRGRIAQGADQWRAALDELIGDRELRCALGDLARADLLERWSEEARASELRCVLEEPARGRGFAVPVPPALVDDEPAAEVALEPDACPAGGLVEIGGFTPPLGDTQRLVQRLVPLREGLCRVDVYSVTWGQALHHELVLRLRSDEGEIVAQRTLPAAHAPDRSWLALEMPPQPRSKGTTYELELVARGSGVGNALSFGLASEAGEPACLGDRALERPLALRLFADWDRILGSGAAVARGAA